MHIDYENLGKRIRTLRQQRHLSQEGLAEKIGRSRTFVSYIESGAKVSSLDTFVGLAVALGVTPNDLLTDSFPVQKENHSHCAPQNQLIGLSILTEASESLMAILQKYNMIK